MALDMQTQMRLTGMASGLDTDAIIQNLGKVSTMRINKVKQDKQIAVWKQEIYRDTISKLTNFMKSNLNIANPTSNFRSSAAFAKFTYNLKGKVGGIDASELFSVTANGDLRNFNQVVQGVAQLATKDTWVGSSMNLQGIRTSGFDYEKFGIKDILGVGIGMVDPKYAVIGISIDGTSKTISIPPEKILDAAWGGKYDQEYPAGSKILTGSDKTFAVDHLVNGIFQANGKDIYVRNDVAGTYDPVNIGVLDAIVDDAGLGTAFNSGDQAHKDAVRAYFAGQTISYNEPAAKDDLVDSFIDGSSSGNYYVYRNGDYQKVDDVLLGEITGRVGGYDPITTPPTPAERMAIEDFFNNNAIFVDGANYTPDTTQSFANLLNDEIKNLFGANYSNVVSVENGELKFLKSGSNITLFEVTGFDTLKNMGLEGGASTAGAVTNKKLGEVAGGLFPPGAKETTIKINNVNIKLSSDDTMKTVMDKINGSDANVTLSYSNATDSFTLASKLEGTANGVTFDGYASELFKGLNILDSSGVAVNRQEAKNFIGQINGETFIRQSNTFTHEGMTYTFNKTFNATLGPGDTITIDNPAESAKIEVSKNTADIITGIKGFVEEYNKLVTHINDLLNGKRDRDYQPLTDDEKKAMTADEVKLYEEKTKIGLMANDSQLRKLLSDMRTSIYQKVEGVGLTMTDIGITTTANYKDGGLLVIDEDKLKKALENNYDGVVSLFTKSSDIPMYEYTTNGNGEMTSRLNNSAKLAQRTAESGIAQRLNDILTGAAGTSTSGTKGYLVQLAGMVNDRTQSDNPMTKKIEEYDKKIDKLLERWYRQENNYYAMFSRMETAMSKLQAQQNSLAQIMAQGGGK